jgi:hypothetical protein
MTITLPEWVNASTFTALGMAVVLVRMILEWLAPRTKTTLDDRALEAVKAAQQTASTAKAFIEDNAGSVWGIVEQMKESGLIKPDGRLGKFLDEIEKAYQEATGQSLTPEERLEAAKEAVAISKADKAVRPNGEIRVGPNETTIGVRLGKALAHLRLARGEKPKVGLSVKF